MMQYKDTKVHFSFGTWKPDYWRHHFDLNDEEKIVVDFVKSRNTRGCRINIRRMKKTVRHWRNDGSPVNFYGWQTAACWMSPTGSLSDIKDSKNNSKQRDGSELEDWRPYMQIVVEALS